MSECAYHPGIEAADECQRCKRPICENDKRNYTSIDMRHGMGGHDHASVYTLCPLCVTTEQGEDSFAAIAVTALVQIAWLVILVISLIKGTVIIFGSVLVLVITGVIATSLFAITLWGTGREKRIARAEMLKFLKTLTWNTPGNANVTVNELLELPPEKMKVRIEQMYHELEYVPHASIKEQALLKRCFETTKWDLNNLGALFTYLKKNIEYWSWRVDLTDASKNRVAVAFMYLLAVHHIGKTQTDQILVKAPPGFVQLSLIPQLLQDYF